MHTELNVQIDRRRAPRRADRCSVDKLAGSSTLDDLWSRLSNRLFAVVTAPLSATDYERLCPGDMRRILAAADEALARRVDLLGSGPCTLATPIDWHTDFKAGVSWPLRFMRDIACTDLMSPSDVKVPWELSRLQWLIPAGQAFQLTGDERYAAAVRDVIDEWIDANPYAHGANWACTMEVAMRILTWAWFFHVFCRSAAWSDERFRNRFLRTLYLHGEFTERYLEQSDVNGNHFTADAVALVVAGLFFGAGDDPKRWAAVGWQLLSDDLPRQVTPDGVDFEGSTAYHRLVLELAFLAARQREAVGLTVDTAFRERLIAMARFTLAYSRARGGSPHLGDADDARALPFGGQPLDDHRYLVGLIGAHWSVPDLIRGFSGSRAEIVWALGRSAGASLPDTLESQQTASTSFGDAGYFVMRNAEDHIFIDCAGVGQNGRGGHGHNDCLSFEAVLAGTLLVADCGSYVYTADAHERNRFRSTAYHNTPQIDSQELNRFYRWDQLWTLRNDASPVVHAWEPGRQLDRFVGSHTGYQRLSRAIVPVRTIELDHEQHTLRIADEIEGDGSHEVTVPLHLAAGVIVRSVDDGVVVLTVGDAEFVLTWSSAQTWQLDIDAARLSPRYGVVEPCARLAWSYSGPLPAALEMTLAPAAAHRSRPAARSAAMVNA